MERDRDKRPVKVGPGWSVYTTPGRDQFRDDHNCHTEQCTWSIEPFRPEPPYFLYSINKTTGAMSPFDVSDPKRACFVCLGNQSG